LKNYIDFNQISFKIFLITDQNLILRYDVIMFNNTKAKEYYKKSANYYFKMYGNHAKVAEQY